MRILGYCTRCRKVKPVRVSGSMSVKHIAVGICATCEQQRKESRRAR